MVETGPTNFGRGNVVFSRMRNRETAAYPVRPPESRLSASHPIAVVPKTVTVA
ncbi:MAG: hypothetical protein ACKVOS_13445 [Sphingorhabdus sp.]|uniref:hypothetical protein n=1 Tax=Sphingorhabdus sp. TaxID=1902408 RepID=UPI0038FC2001